MYMRGWGCGMAEWEMRPIIRQTWEFPTKKWNQEKNIKNERQFGLVSDNGFGVSEWQSSWSLLPPTLLLFCCE